MDAKQFEGIDPDTPHAELREVIVEGITADHIWYNASVLTRKMSLWSDEFRKLVNVMEARHKDHTKMIEDLLGERKALYKELAALKCEKKE
jgi:shikimate kinase